jgi:hypothetical protein
VADAYLLENNTDKYLLEDGSGVLLLNFVNPGDVREYDGTDDNTQFSKGDVTSAANGFTLAVLCKRINTGAGLQTILSMNEDPGNEWTWAFGVDSNSDLFYIERAQGNESLGAVGFQQADGWCLCVVTKASGAGVTPRFHFLPLGGSWTHTNGSLTVNASATPSTNARLWIGANQNGGSASNFAGVQVAAAGYVSNNSSDATVENAGLEYHIDNWTDFFTGVEDWAVALNQASTATAIEDLSVGNGDEVAETGTTVIADGGPAGFDFGAVDQTIALGQVTETETGQVVTVLKDVALGQVEETETGQAVTTPKTVLLGQATETETSQAVTTPKLVVLTQVVETEEAQVITVIMGGGQTIILGQVVETETGQALAVEKSVALGQVIETENPQALAQVLKTVALGQATETESGQALTVNKTALLTQATETETAQGLTVQKVVLPGQVTETEAPQGVTTPKAVLLGQVIENETAQAVLMFTQGDGPPLVFLLRLPAYDFVTAYDSDWSAVLNPTYIVTEDI